jgi:urease beta subunit
VRELCEAHARGGTVPSQALAGAAMWLHESQDRAAAATLCASLGTGPDAGPGRRSAAPWDIPEASAARCFAAVLLARLAATRPAAGTDMASVARIVATETRTLARARERARSAEQQTWGNRGRRAVGAEIYYADRSHGAGSHAHLVAAMDALTLRREPTAALALCEMLGPSLVHRSAARSSKLQLPSRGAFATRAEAADPRLRIALANAHGACRAPGASAAAKHALAALANGRHLLSLADVLVAAVALAEGGYIDGAAALMSADCVSLLHVPQLAASRVITAAAGVE